MTTIQVKGQLILWAVYYSLVLLFLLLLSVGVGFMIAASLASYLSGIGGPEASIIRLGQFCSLAIFLGFGRFLWQEVRSRLYHRLTFQEQGILIDRLGGRQSRWAYGELEGIQHYGRDFCLKGPSGQVILLRPQRPQDSHRLLSRISQAIASGWNERLQAGEIMSFQEVTCSNLGLRVAANAFVPWSQINSVQLRLAGLVVTTDHFTLQLRHQPNTLAILHLITLRIEQQGGGEVRLLDIYNG